MYYSSLRIYLLQKIRYVSIPNLSHGGSATEVSWAGRGWGGRALEGRGEWTALIHCRWAARQTFVFPLIFVGITQMCPGMYVPSHCNMKKYLKFVFLYMVMYRNLNNSVMGPSWKTGKPFLPNDFLVLLKICSTIWIFRIQSHLLLLECISRYLMDICQH